MKEKIGSMKWKILAGGILLGISMGIYFFAEPAEVFSEREPEILIEKSEAPAAAETPLEEVSSVIVDIGGAVIFSGVLELPEGSRVYEAVEAAGGVTAEADLRSINLAAELHDGEKIYIPTKAEAEEMALSGTSGLTGKVNINTANASVLETLKGVGPATAAAIIQHRTQKGPFKTPEDLMDVSGIGKKTYEGLKDHIRVS